MTKYKITIHCGNVNSFKFEEYESVDKSLEFYLAQIKKKEFIRFGDILINTSHITFIQIEEVKIVESEPSDAVDIDA